MILSLALPLPAAPPARRLRAASRHLDRLRAEARLELHAPDHLRGGLRARAIALCQVLVSYVSCRFPRTRKVIEGAPIVVVQDGSPTGELSFIEKGG